MNIFLERLKKEKFIRLCEHPETSLVMSKKRKKILALVKEKKEISLTGLKALVPTAPSLIKPLEAAGYIKIVFRQVFRDPLGDPVEPDSPPQLTQEQDLNATQL